MRRTLYDKRIYSQYKILGYLKKVGEGERKTKNSTCVVTQIEVLS